MLQPPIKIETGVPIPTGRATHLYPFADMKAGDSFVIPDGSLNARSGLYGVAKRVGAKIAIRKEGNGFRVWRIA